MHWSDLRCFNKLKHFRRITTRFDRRDVTSTASYNLLAPALATLKADSA